MAVRSANMRIFAERKATTCELRHTWLGQCDVADPHGRSNRLLAFTAGRATGKNDTLRGCSPVNAHILGYDGYTVQQWTIRGGQRKSKLELSNEVL